MWIGSSRRLWERKPRVGSRRAQGPSPPPPRLAPCSDTHLAVILGVQGSTGLAEERNVLRHVGKAGNDLIKVPGGTGQRGRAEGPLSHKAIGQARPSLFPNHHSASTSKSVQNSCGSWLGPRHHRWGLSQKGRMNLCDLRCWIKEMIPNTLGAWLGSPFYWLGDPCDLISLLWVNWG